MKLLTKEIMKKLPPVYAQDSLGGEAVIHVKFFTPDANWTWFITEGNPIVIRGDVRMELAEGYAGVQEGDEIVDWMFFGLVHGFEKEYGSVLLSQIQAVRGALNLPVERDKYFEGKIKDVK